MNYNNFALYGFAILFIIYLYYLSLNLKENNYIIFGSILVTIGYLFAVLELYNNNKYKNKIAKSHLILGAFLLLSLILPINKHSKNTDIFGLIGHLILIHGDFGYTKLANICMTIYYVLYTYRNGIKNNIIEKVQGVGGGLVLLYYIKKMINDWYTNKEKKLENKK